MIDHRGLAERRTGRDRRTRYRRAAYLPVANERRSGLDRRLSPRRFTAWERRA